MFVPVACLWVPVVAELAWLLPPLAACLWMHVEPLRALTPGLARPVLWIGFKGWLFGGLTLLGPGH